jgi:hypothetical protein
LCERYRTYILSRINNLTQGKAMLKLIKTIAAVSALALMTACGGGGGGGGSTVANADPQGIWTGPTSTGYTASVVVLETGETWGVYSSGTTIYGALYGTTTTAGNNVSVSGTDFSFLTNTSASDTLTGSIVAKSSMSLTGNTVTVPLTYSNSYDATPVAVTGTWSFVGRSKSYSLLPGTITIDNNGSFTLNQTNCVTTGSVVPRSTGKNIYNISLSSVGSGCAVGQSSTAGVAYVDTTVTPNKLLSLALTTDKTDGVVVIGTKQ